MSVAVHRIDYLHRDASNYKFWGELFVSGPFRPDLLRDHLFDGEWFVPEAIGVRPLVPSVRNENDHELHEFFEVNATTERRFDIDADELERRIKKAGQQGWFAERKEYREFVGSPRAFT